jgi:hypothetical protein
VLAIWSRYRKHHNSSKFESIEWFRWAQKEQELRNTLKRIAEKYRRKQCMQKNLKGNVIICQQHAWQRARTTCLDNVLGQRAWTTSQSFCGALSLNYFSDNHDQLSCWQMRWTSNLIDRSQKWFVFWDSQLSLMLIVLFIKPIPLT